MKLPKMQKLTFPGSFLDFSRTWGGPEPRERATFEQNFFSDICLSALFEIPKKCFSEPV